MTRISNLLFAVVFLSIFSYLLIYIFASGGGNGGEYWGFDGRIEPHQAAVEAYEAERYEFLALEMQREIGGLVTVSPQLLECSSTAGQIVTTVRHNQGEPVHGPDSVDLAAEFARTYNHRMDGLIRSKLGYRCELRID